ncbi:glycine cleavage system aminomethyltransferase GcvT [candidate division KSB1 bacterium]|nr:glycine cleavage system aminomethyltransferase GcvT [candidate division KSB1 bacterium]
MKKTAFYDIHTKYNAKLVEFAGFYMPIQYRGINEEHIRVRTTVGVFDVSHMGEFEFIGPKAEEFLQLMTANDVKKLEMYQAHYSALCYENGGIVDDLLIYRFPEKFIMVVNAANLEKDFQWLIEHLIDGVIMKNRSDEYSLLAIQGNKAEATLQKLTDEDLSQIKNYWLTEGTLADVPMMIARTGYTGEDGFEIMFPVKHSEHVWNAVMTAGAEFDIEPIGLAARDTLRMEVKYCLYGNDIDQTTNPLEAGLGWITKLDKGNFIGRDAILKIKQAGIGRKLIGFELEGRAIPRHGYPIFSGDSQIGVVTSGMFSPMLQKPIGLGYVPLNYAEIGSKINIDIRGRKFPADVVKTPFYKRPY